jgi:hypothetical protein
MFYTQYGFLESKNLRKFSMKKRLYYLLFALLSTVSLRAQITSYPHFTNFESEGLCGTSCTGACNLTGTWRNADQYGFPQAGTDWLAEDGSTPSSATGPDIDHTLGTATGKYVYTETSGCTNVSAHLVSAIYDFSALTAPKVSFYYHMLGATMGTMHFDVDTTGTGTWVLDVTPAWTDNINAWQLKIVDLSSYGGRSSVRLRIRATTGTSFTSDMAVDDIEVFEPAPYDYNVISVNAGGGCGNSATTPVILTFANAGTDTFSIGDTVYFSFEIGGNTVTDTAVLTSDVLPGDTTTYTFVNGTADLSGPSSITINAWSAYGLDANTGNDSTSVVTIGIPIISTYPYSQDFETGQNGWRITNGSAGVWAFGTPAKPVINSASSGVNCFVTNLTGSYNDNDFSWVEGPCFDFSGVCDPVISLRVWWNAEFSWDGMNVTISTDGGTTWSLVGAFGDPLNWYTDNTIVGNPGGFQSGWSGRNSTTNGSGGWVTAKHHLTGAGGFSNVKVRINFASDGSVIDDGVAFDDIKIYDGVWLGDDQLVCSPSTVTLDAAAGLGTDTYAWNTGSTSNTITATTTGYYGLTFTSGACVNSDSIYVVVVDSNSAVSLGADTAACGTYTLDAGIWPGATIVWSTGDTAQSIAASASGTYMVDVITSCGTLSDTIALQLAPTPVVNLGNDVTGCDLYVLDAGNPGLTYLWSTAEVTQSITVTASGGYAVWVTDSIGCTGADSINIVIIPAPVVNLGPDQVLCNGATATLDAGNAGSSFAWSTSDSSQTIVVSAAGNYSVIVTDTSGCSGMDTVSVTAANNPTANFSFTIAGAGLDYSFTSTSTGATSYSWTFGDGGTSTLQNPTHTYAPGSYTATLIVTNACGSDTFTQAVTVVGLANSLGNGTVKVFPNPSNGKFRVTFDLGVAEEVTLTVQNLAGQVVFAQDLGLVGGRVNQEVTLQDLPAGMYMLRLQSETAQSVHMLRVE